MSLYFALSTVENNKKKKSVKFLGDTLSFCDFIQVYVFTTNHHLNIPSNSKYHSIVYFRFYSLLAEVSIAKIAEPQHIKPTNWHVHPAKTQISLGLC